MEQRALVSTEEALGARQQLMRLQQRLRSPQGPAPSPTRKGDPLPLHFWVPAWGCARRASPLPPTWLAPSRLPSFPPFQIALGRSARLPPSSRKLPKRQPQQLGGSNACLFAVVVNTHTHTHMPTLFRKERAPRTPEIRAGTLPGACPHAQQVQPRPNAHSIRPEERRILVLTLPPRVSCTPNVIIQ